MQTSSCLTLRSSVKSQKSDICFKVKLKSSPLNFGPFLRKYVSLGKWFGKPWIPEKFMHAYLEIRMAAYDFFITLEESPWIYEFWILQQWSHQGSSATSNKFWAPATFKSSASWFSGDIYLQTLGRCTKMLSQNQTLIGCWSRRLRVTISNQTFSWGLASSTWEGSLNRFMIFK